MKTQQKTINIFPLQKISGAFLILLITFGCSIPKSTSEDLVKSYASVAAKTSKSREIEQLNTKIFSTANLNIDPSDYLLGAGDLIEVKVLEATELDTTSRVSSRGTVSLPLLDQVQLKNLSAAEAEEYIEKLYKEQYIKDPHVSIFIKEHFSQRITLVGQVKNPGTYDYLAKQRLLDVLALAGGLTERAGPLVQIRRNGASPDNQNMYMVDLEKLIKEGNVDLNIAINGGDVVFVSEAGTFFVDGAVRKPGSYPLKSKTTIQEAILAASGFAPYADKNKITIIRRDSLEGRQIIRINLEEDLQAQEMEILDHDIVIAKDTAWGKLVHGTGINIGVPGFLGIGYRNPTQ
jgi:polysaccharide export outer membrane protein